MKPVLTITLNPAVDITIDVDRLVPRKKLRTGAPRFDPGGGGVNVSRVIKELGGQSTAFVATAGPMGELMRQMLAEAGIEARYLEIDGMTRPSVKLHVQATGEQYRLVPPGPRQRSGAAEKILRALEGLMDEERFTYVIISGSVPPGISDSFWHRLVKLCNDRATRLVLDSSGKGLSVGLEAGVYLVKPDQDEVNTLRREMGLAAETPGSIARELVRRKHAEAVVVTLGKKGAFFVSDADEGEISAPHAEVRSMVGAGDSFLVAMIFGLANDWALRKACTYGVAAAAAAVTTPATELSHREDIERLFEQMNSQVRS